MNRKYFLVAESVLLICLLICIGFLFFIFHSSRGSFVPLKTDNDESVLIGPQYKTVSDGLIETLNKQNPRVAIAQLESEMQKNPKVLASCHELLHVIGRASYRKYNSFTEAMLYRNDLCVSGYVHGVIEAFSWQNKNNSKKIMSVCNNTPQGKYSRWACIHGIGHGLMFSSESNVPYSLNKCSQFTTYFDQDACYSGVYMQNFNFDPDDHPSKYVSFTDPFQACRFPSNHQDECYYNAPIFYLNYRPGDYKGALQWCSNAPLVYQKNCYEGVGSQITAQIFHDPKKIEVVCRANGNGTTKACLLGMMSWYIDYYASLGPAEKICSTLDKQDESLCQQTIQSEKSMF